MAEAMQQRKPKIQEIRDDFFQSPLATNLLYNEEDKLFYTYNESTSTYVPLANGELPKLLDEFLLKTYGVNNPLSITEQVIREVRASLLRDQSGSLTVIKTITPQSSFKDALVFDFKTVTIIPSSPKVHSFHHFDFSFPITPTPTPSFDAFLLSTFTHSDGTEDKELADFMLSVLAYYLSPILPTDPIAFVLQGSGANGKSIFLNLLQSFIGEEYVAALSMEDLSERFNLPSLIGKRLNIVTEDQSKFVKADKLKAVISGERVRVERKYEEPFFFSPKVKHIFSTNKDVKFDDVDYATLRRIFVVPFNRTFVSADFISQAILTSTALSSWQKTKDSN